jgi:hypothetical protein
MVLTFVYHDVACVLSDVLLFWQFVYCLIVDTFIVIPSSVVFFVFPFIGHYCKCALLLLSIQYNGNAMCKLLIVSSTEC